MKLFLSLFVFSILLFSSSLLFFPFLHSFSLYVSATFHKNYVFLLCNGILVIIVRNSGSAPASSGHGGELSEIREKREAELPLETREAEEKGGDIRVHEKERGGNEDDDDKKGLAMAEEEEEEEEEEEDEMLSAEELHRKCDDFIRRVKEERRFETEPVF